VHSTRCTHVTEVVLLIALLVATEALVEGLATVRGLHVQGLQRGIKHGGRRRPLTRSLLGGLGSLNEGLDPPMKVRHLVLREEIHGGSSGVLRELRHQIEPQGEVFEGGGRFHDGRKAGRVG